MGNEVGSGQVAIFPTFKGFRKATDSEATAATKSASSIFGSGFSKAGGDAGSGFKKSFATTTKGLGDGLLKSATAEVARSSRDIATARLKEQDAAGKVRLAEAQLAEARSKYAAGSSQVIRAEERLAGAQRARTGIQEHLLGATDRLTRAQKELAAAAKVADTTAVGGGGFRGVVSGFADAGANGARAFGTGFTNVLGGVLGAGVLLGVGQRISDGIGAGIAYGLESINLASDLQQSTGAVEAVFKDQKGVILSAAKAASTAVGLTRSAYQKFATVVGAQFKNLGVPFDQVAGKTNDLISLGADLAAQFGGTTSDAVSALSSLLRGERDPIERYGVSIKQADIEARLASKGLQDLTGDAEKQASIVETLGLLWEQTADAQGTFAREQDTYAGKQQVLVAQLEEAQTRLGDALLPTATELTEFAASELVPVLESSLDTIGPALVQVFRENAPEIKAILEGALESLPETVDGLLSLIKQIDETGKGIETVKNSGNDFIGQNRSELLTILVPPAGLFLTAQEAWEEAGRANSLAYNTSLAQGLGGFEGLTLQSRLEGITAESTPFWAFKGDEGSTAFIDRLKFGISSGSESVRNATSATGGEAVSGLTAGSIGAPNAGYNMSAGFANGITEGKYLAEDAAAFMGAAALGALKGALGEASPSKFARRSGVNTTEGFRLGILDDLSGVAAASRELALAGLPSVGSVYDMASGPSSLQATRGGQAQQLTAVLQIDGRTAAEAMFKPLRELNESLKN